MKDPYHRAEEALVSLEQRTQYDSQNRLELLAVHGIKGVLLGPLIYHGGAPDAWNQVFGAETVIFLSTPAFFGGLLLVLGLVWNRNLVLELLGMLLLLTWDTLMISVMVQAGQNPYVIVIYGGFAALMFIHLKTLWHYLRGRWEDVSHADG